MFLLCLPEDVMNHVVTLMWNIRSISYLDMAITNSSYRPIFLLQLKQIHLAEEVVLYTFKCIHKHKTKTHPSTYDFSLFLAWVNKRRVIFTKATISMKCNDIINISDHWNQQLNILEYAFSNIHESLKHLQFSDIVTMYAGHENFGKRRLENFQMKNKIYEKVGQFVNDINDVRVRFVDTINKFTKLSSLCFTSMGHDGILLMSISPVILNRLTTLHLESLWESTAMSLLALSYLADNCRSMRSFRLLCEYTVNPGDIFCLPELHLVHLLECMPHLEIFELKCKGSFTDVTLDTLLQKNSSLHTIKLGMICKASCIELLVLLVEKAQLVVLEFGAHPADSWSHTDNTPNLIYHNNGDGKSLKLVNSLSNPNIHEQTNFLLYDQFDQFFIALKGLEFVGLHGIFSATILKYIAANNPKLRHLQLCTLKNKRVRLSEQEIIYLRKFCKHVAVT
jgi:hypothetical protein